MKIKAIVICFLLIIFFIFFQNVRLSPIINDESIKYSFDPIEKVWFESNAGVGEVLLDSTYQKIFFASSGSSGSGGCPDGSTSCGSVCCDSSHPCCGTFCCNENHQCANSNLGICCHNSYTVCNDGPPYSWLPPGSGPSSYCCPQGQTCNKGVCKEICQPDEEECNGSCCAGDCLDTPSGKKCCSEGDVICGDSCCGPNEECDYQKICNSGYCVSSSNIGGDLVCKPIDSCNNNDDCSCPNGQEMCNGSCCDIGKCGPQKICSTVFGFNVCLTTPQDVCNPINQCNNSIDCGCPNGEIMCNGSCCAGTCGKNYLCNASGVCVADGDDVCNPSNTCGSSCPCPSGQVMCNGSCCAGSCGKSSFCD
ncbi:MAG TPA: hypothetical protein PKK60_00430, partial [archaeon]|nr:hypothetical protein [archaeon]